MKKILILIAVVIAFVIPITAFAATNAASPNPAKGAAEKFQKEPLFDPSKLTDAQKKVLEEQQGKAIALKKETINKMVESGIITKEKGDTMISRLDQKEKIHKEKGLVGFGFGKGGRCKNKGGNSSQNYSEAS